MTCGCYAPLHVSQPISLPRALFVLNDIPRPSEPHVSIHRYRLQKALDTRVSAALDHKSLKPEPGGTGAPEATLRRLWSTYS